MKQQQQGDKVKIDRIKPDVAPPKQEPKKPKTTKGKADGRRRIAARRVAVVERDSRNGLPKADGVIRRLVSTGKIEETFFNPSQNFHRYRVVEQDI